ncbi:nitrogenase-stabilizing/protective protein [Novosphingobium sp. SG751A]|uniref:nitrogenase stabilizing/protective protein NifW n=1 Tax=Novosphingobium sp. SG751A TaxID=2587000 RepID=UPI0015546378|nr:nitrogenase stabilizing/protective protein NifW [Novosphingobium sp. SG751A]NOW48475.1 nitrogenase-stabilizing/protective protein [Novosphingobium sp. SG751A]
MNLLDRLQSLSSAEDFFVTLNVPYDEAILRVARLHILRRMGQYLKGSAVNGELDEADPAAIYQTCRDHLMQAYEDFVASSPIAQRIFKVHQDAIAPKPEPNRPFVPLSALTGE